MIGVRWVLHLFVPVQLLNTGTELIECRRHRIEWTYGIEHDPGVLDMDAEQMEQALVDIARNAIEANGEEGRITTNLGQDRDRPTLVLADTGPGIAPAVRDQLFIPFYSTKRNGQGIGLTFAGEILRRHGFAYGLESGDHGGARFTIVF